MLRLSLRNLRKIAPLQASKGSQPHPFGGKFPTRIAIDVRWGRRSSERWQYIGVPSIYAIHALNKRMRFRYAAAKYWEFDRKGQLHYAHCQPGANRLRVQNYNSTLIGVYHHWNNVADPFLGFQAAYFTKKVQGRWIYSPFEHLKLDTHLRPYKTWLAEALATKPKVLKHEGYNFSFNMQPLPEPRFRDEGIQVVPNNPADALAAQTLENIMNQQRRAQARDVLARRLRNINGFPE